MHLKKSNKNRKPMSLDVPWVVINRRTGKAIATVTPAGKKLVLSQAAVRIAREHKLPFNAIHLTPIELLTDEQRDQVDLDAAPAWAEPASN